jgi:hypothetical protein
MDWKRVDRKNPREALPKDKVFLALWKGVICLCEFDEDIDHFYIGMMPAVYLGFWKLDKEREGKFTHWCELNMPCDY